MSTALGKEGEDLACKILEKEGYRIFVRNYRSKFGEIDIISKKKGSYVFVEVKYRHNAGFGLPQEAVTPLKLEKIKKTAEIYLFEKGLNPDWRIDVITLDPDNKKYEIFENVLT